jgi:hypothetical protein
MKLTTFLAAVAAMFISAQSAQAREHHHQHRHHGVVAHEGIASPLRYESAQNASTDGYGGRPAAWCGWEMRHLVSSDPGPAFNLARSWAHWGQSGAAGVGAVVVWSHHVGKIVGQENGMWVIESGNDGRQVRTRQRSIAGAIAIRWG